MKKAIGKPGATHDALPLRAVSAMTGLTPDLIRAWEKRYAVVSPLRGARGARLYSAADVAHLRLLARAVAAGRMIGDVAAASHSELQQIVAQGIPPHALPPAAAYPGVIDSVLGSLERFDHLGVARILGDAVLSLGVRAFVHEVAFPLVHHVGERWESGQLSIAHEHLFSAALRNLLSALLQSRRADGRSLLLTTPSGERHETGLLLVALLAAEHDFRVIYLGADLPAKEILAAARETKAEVVGLSTVATTNRAQASQEVAAVHAGLSAGTELWLGGADAAPVAKGSKARRALVFGSLLATEGELARLRSLHGQSKSSSIGT